MERLDEILSRIALPSAPAPGIGFAALVDRVHRAFLRRALDVESDGEDPSPEDLTWLRRLGLYLEAETTLSAPPAEQELQDSLYVAASIFEFLGAYEHALNPAGTPAAELASRLASGDLADFVRSMVLYSLGRHESNSSVLGRRLLQRLSPAGESDLSLADDIVLVGLRVLVGFVSHDLRSAIRNAGRLGDLGLRMRREWAGSGFPSDGGEFLAAWLEMTDAAAMAAAGIVTGVDAVFRRGRARVTQATERAMLLRQPFAFWVADRLGLLADSMQSRSVFRALDGTGMDSRYLRLLAESGVTELWSSQAAALHAGLLSSDDNMAVNLPTGAGKSLLAELAIAKAVAGTDGWGLYLVPSRALVHQVEADLGLRLPFMNVVVRTVLAGAEPGSMLSDEIAEIVAPHTLTILTPEKLDVYFRNRPDLFSSCRLLIVDEAHKVGDPGRGALVDSLLTRFRILVPTARLLLLSAVMSNIFEVSRWLGSPERGVRSLWRPTRQIKGLAAAYNISELNEIRPVRKEMRRERVTRYDCGIVVAHRASDLSRQEIPVDIPGVSSGETRSWRRPDGGMQHSGTSTTDQAADIALRFARLPGVTVVFLGTRPSAEKCAKEIARRLRQEDRRTPPPQLIQHLEVLLGPGHELVALARTGVAYHHAHLPRPVRRAVEAALKDGWLGVICATATLQEGLNTPATTVIVAGSYRLIRSLIARFPCRCSTSRISLVEPAEQGRIPRDK